MSEQPIVGALAVYAPLNLPAPDAERDPTLGHVVPLRLGDAILVGRLHRQHVKIGERMVPVTASVRYPDREPYLAVSRTHLVLEVLPEGITRITDLSSAGYYAQHLARYVRSPRGESSVVDCEGPEMLFLAAQALERDASPEQLAAHAPSRIQLLRFDADTEPTS